MTLTNIWMMMTGIRTSDLAFLGDLVWCGVFWLNKPLSSGVGSVKRADILLRRGRARGPRTSHVTEHVYMRTSGPYIYTQHRVRVDLERRFFCEMSSNHSSHRARLLHNSVCPSRLKHVRRSYLPGWAHRTHGASGEPKNRSSGVAHERCGCHCPRRSTVCRDGLTLD